MSTLQKDDIKQTLRNEAQPMQALNDQPKRFTKIRHLSISPSVRRVNQIFENHTEENSLALKLKCDERFFRIREKQKEFKSVVAELLRLELLKTGIKREEISKF